MDKNFLRKIANSTKKNISNPVIKNVYVNTTIPEPNNLDTPSLIKNTYDEDINIVTIHNTIRLKFGSLLGKLDLMKKYILKLNKDLECAKNIVTKNEIHSQIKLLEEEIYSLESNSKWNKYVEESKDLLERYIPLATNNCTTTIIVSNKSEKKFSNEEIQTRLNIIAEYLDVAKKYIGIDIKCNYSLENNCPVCDGDFNKFFDIDDSGVFQCKCGYILDNLDRNSTYKDID